jgi:hypothetical protein
MIIYLVYILAIAIAVMVFKWGAIQQLLMRKFKVDLAFDSITRISHFSIFREMKKIDIHSMFMKVKGVSFSRIKGLHFELSIDLVEVSLTLNSIDLVDFNNFEDSSENFLKVLHNVLRIKGELNRVLQNQSENFDKSYKKKAVKGFNINDRGFNLESCSELSHQACGYLHPAYHPS